MPSVEIRADYTGIPHSFLIVTGPDGSVQGFGFAPRETGLFGVGAINDDLNYEYEYEYE